MLAMQHAYALFGMYCITWLRSCWKPVLVDGSCPVTQPLLETQTVSTQNIAGLEVTAAAHQDSLNSTMYWYQTVSMSC